MKPFTFQYDLADGGDYIAQDQRVTVPGEDEEDAKEFAETLISTHESGQIVNLFHVEDPIDRGKIYQ